MSEKEYYLLTDSAWVPENIEIEGEYFSNGKIVTGIGTSFTRDLQGGDWLVHPTLNEVSMIRTVETDTRLELYKPFSQDVSSFDPDYQAVLDYATTQGYTLPSAGQQTLQNQLVVDLKAAGVWSKLDSLAVFATDGDATFALVDWIRLITMTAVNSPTFTANQGFQGDRVSADINTLFSPSSGINYQLSNSSVGGYFNNTNTRTGGISLGTRVASNNNTSGVYPSSATVIGTAINNSTGFANLLYTRSNGLHAVNRTSSSNFNAYLNGSLIDNASRLEAATLNTNNYYAFSLNSGGTPVAFSDDQLSVIYFGANLTAEQADLNTAIQTYISSL